MTLIDPHRIVVIATSAAFVLCANALTARDARAELGGTVTTLPVNENCTQRAVPSGTVRIRATVDAGGTTIREYATCDGYVFAYAWQGPTMPDLARLLGRYAERYRAKAATQLGAFGYLHASRVDQPDIVVESGGQMRSYVGRAWLPAAVPSGFSLADLR
ncbi:DUF2844 domain-containing protein [Paraburkholderia phymatum]|uniref:DUF2844 domain-containing protein n=1 Tax=Paraburkholderia phymatum (strain DSM 17167 / CIP 108236 / LMG 21445 / STM815) TaxID=391038 RepID=B2JJG3_PARP8|nr:DUF2844 domain-containing protein [Paraburkholderia phymatum]ACC70706.1 conserved hypothetical protein [Paraburkholderia phymatum STM815]